MNIISEREETKKAIRWVSEKLEEDPAQSIHKLVDKAIFEFNLSPADAEFLIRFFHERGLKHPAP
ncbi:MAG TPA: hypothetical protein PLA83_04970 [Deltaproteobacteria bacterium]|jgi:hypothetical protein|nr:hypothetical protein [Deltaproteobacteria bacterium]HQI00161.1 hypothetical protein [Deltaproteobacteria bacterium]HQJ07451.1 hypothetical protein [Deltaproteobacteria bacterium]